MGYVRDPIPIFILYVYMDDLIKMLSNVNAGCGGTLINHLLYGDGLVLVATSRAPDHCYCQSRTKDGTDHDLKYHRSKISVMIFSRKKFRDIHIPNFV